MQLTIIIPVYNEDKTITKTLSYLIEIFKIKKENKSNFAEIIVVDSSNNTKTIDATNKYQCKIIKSDKKYRSYQMNLGAKNSKGKLLLFLHADTILPINSLEIFKDIIKNKYSYGAFYKKFNPNNLFLRLISIVNNFQLNYFKNMLGDNAIFIKKTVFDKINGFKDIKLMEDVEISKTLKKYSKKSIIIKTPVITSSRKFIKNGTFKTFLLMQRLRIDYFFNKDTEKLFKRYYKQ